MAKLSPLAKKVGRKTAVNERWVMVYTRLRFRDYRALKRLCKKKSITMAHYLRQKVLDLAI